MPTMAMAVKQINNHSMSIMCLDCPFCDGDMGVIVVML